LEEDRAGVGAAAACEGVGCDAFGAGDGEFGDLENRWWFCLLSFAIPRLHLEVADGDTDGLATKAAVALALSAERAAVLDNIIVPFFSSSVVQLWFQLDRPRGDWESRSPFRRWERVKPAAPRN